MSRRLALSAFSADICAFEASARRVAGQRSFTSTPRRDAQITRFSPTSNPDLDTLLSNIRTKIILPSYLPLVQRKKILNPKYAKKLQADPIIIDIDGEVLKFRHQNPFSGEIPNTRKSVIHAIESFETPDDFANLKPLLEGIAHTGYKFEPDFYAKILRNCGKKGYIYDIIECARGVQRTAFKLDSSEKVNETLHFVQMMAIDAGWAEGKTRKALRWAEMVVELIQEEGHQPKRRKYEVPLAGELPLARDPMVLASPLHLAAVLVSKYGAGEEAVDKVNRLAKDIVKLWPEGKKLKEVQPQELYQDYDKMGYLLEPNKFVTLASPLLYGLGIAIQVVDTELAQQLQSRHDTLAAEIQEARQAKGPQTKRGEAVYSKLFNA
ncbi:hypothetical protein F5Y15DRAFT_423035 [Xylariaceae sp. FL0016]|nr:hypothetical protein F5Y15DRAFT_423035 [Xylariaceae sp. FL0016]